MAEAPYELISADFAPDGDRVTFRAPGGESTRAAKFEVIEANRDVAALSIYEALHVAWQLVALAAREQLDTETPGAISSIDFAPAGVRITIELPRALGPNHLNEILDSLCEMVDAGIREFRNPEEL